MRAYDVCCRRLVFACTSIHFGCTRSYPIGGSEWGRTEDIWSAQGHPQRSRRNRKKKRPRVWTGSSFSRAGGSYPASKVLFVRFYPSSSSKKAQTDSALLSRLHRAHACENFEHGINRSTHSLPFLSLRIVTPFHFLSPLSASSIEFVSFSVFYLFHKFCLLDFQVSFSPSPATTRFA